MKADEMTMGADNRVFMGGKLIGSVDDDRVYNADGECVGHFDENHVYDDAGTLIGTWDSPDFTYSNGNCIHLHDEPIGFVAAAVLIDF